MFPTSAGTPRAPRNFNRKFQAMLRKGGLHRGRVYELRHWFASLLLSEGVPLSVVSEPMGHAGIQVTKEIYGHIPREAQREAVERLDRLFGAHGRQAQQGKTGPKTWAFDGHSATAGVRFVLPLVADQVWNSGTPGGIRTHDPWFRRPVLYPLSYRRMVAAKNRILGEIGGVSDGN